MLEGPRTSGIGRQAYDFLPELEPIKDALATAGANELPLLADKLEALFQRIDQLGPDARRQIAPQVDPFAAALGTLRRVEKLLGGRDPVIAALELLTAPAKAQAIEQAFGELGQVLSERTPELGERVHALGDKVVVRYGAVSLGQQLEREPAPTLGLLLGWLMRSPGLDRLGPLLGRAREGVAALAAGDFARVNALAGELAAPARELATVLTRLAGQARQVSSGIPPAFGGLMAPLPGLAPLAKAVSDLADTLADAPRRTPRGTGDKLLGVLERAAEAIARLPLPQVTAEPAIATHVARQILPLCPWPPQLDERGDAPVKGLAGPKGAPPVTPKAKLTGAFKSEAARAALEARLEAQGLAGRTFLSHEHMWALFGQVAGPLDLAPILAPGGAYLRDDLPREVERVSRQDAAAALAFGRALIAVLGARV